MENGAFNTDLGFQRLKPRLDSNLLFSIIQTDKLKDEMKFFMSSSGVGMSGTLIPLVQTFLSKFRFLTGFDIPCEWKSKTEIQKMRSAACRQKSF